SVNHALAFTQNAAPAVLDPCDARYMGPKICPPVFLGSDGRAVKNNRVKAVEDINALADRLTTNGFSNEQIRQSPDFVNKVSNYRCGYFKRFKNRCQASGAM